MYLLEEILHVGEVEVVGSQREVGPKAGEVVTRTVGFIVGRPALYLTSCRRPRVRALVPVEALSPPQFEAVHALSDLALTWPPRVVQLVHHSHIVCCAAVQTAWRDEHRDVGLVSWKRPAGLVVLWVRWRVSPGDKEFTLNLCP